MLQNSIARWHATRNSAAHQGVEWKMENRFVWASELNRVHDSGEYL